MEPQVNLDKLMQKKQQPIPENILYFLSPIQLHQYGQQCNSWHPLLSVQSSHSFKSNAFKNDVFSLGLTILQACTLFNIQQIYNFQTFNINYGIVNGLLQEVSQRYQDYLASILVQMLVEEEANRPSLEEIQSKILPFQNTVQEVKLLSPVANDQLQSILQNRTQNQFMSQPIPQATKLLSQSQYLQPSQSAFFNLPQSNIIYPTPSLKTSKILTHSDTDQFKLLPLQFTKSHSVAQQPLSPLNFSPSQQLMNSNIKSPVSATVNFVSEPIGNFTSIAQQQNDNELQFLRQSTKQLSGDNLPPRGIEVHEELEKDKKVKKSKQKSNKKQKPQLEAQSPIKLTTPINQIQTVHGSSQFFFQPQSNTQQVLRMNQSQYINQPLNNFSYVNQFQNEKQYISRNLLNSQIVYQSNYNTPSIISYALQSAQYPQNSIQTPILYYSGLNYQR